MKASVLPDQKEGPVRCLVIQLARLGDTLQSLMALKAAKQLYPQLEITFVARAKFAGAAERVPWIHQVVTLPTDAIIGPILNGEKNETQAVAELARWVSPLLVQPWDLLMNWGYSDASSYLASMIPATVKLGYLRSKDARLSSADGWSHYMQAIVQGQIDQNVHLTDILTTQLLTALQIHVGDPGPGGDVSVNAKSFFNLRPVEHSFIRRWRESTRKWVGFQLGAGNDSKTWAPAHWASMANLILSRHPDWGIVLFGGPEDASREKIFFNSFKQEFPADTDRIVSLVGRSSFDLWASAMAKCHWLVAGDTAAIHLASLLGTRVLNLSIGPVKWNETGPYGNGHYVVAPREQNLTAQAVYGVWSHAIAESFHGASKDLGAHFASLGWKDQMAGIFAFRSKIRPTTDGGGVAFEPLIQRSLTLKNWTSHVMGQIARAWFCGWSAPVGHELNRDDLAPSLLKELRLLQESSDLLIKICDEAHRAAIELADRSAKLKSDRLMSVSDKQTLDEIGKKVIELDQLIERMGRAQEPYRAFSQMARVMMHNLKGTHLSEVSRETAICYRNLREGVKIFRDWLQHTLHLARPVALRTSAPSKTIPLPS